jgi:hypothetical protein
LLLLYCTVAYSPPALAPQPPRSWLYPPTQPEQRQQLRRLAEVVIVPHEMEYSSQFGLMRQKAAEEKRSFVKVLDYYRDRLLHLHTSCPDMAPNISQYQAEHQTWSSSVSTPWNDPEEYWC